MSSTEKTTSSENKKQPISEDIPFKPRAKMTITDVQRRKIQKLMSDPSKPAFVPTRPAGERDPNRAPDFVYNVMGSSAGAGSGEFHVYRQIRRKEMARQKILEGRRRADILNAEFDAKCNENKRIEAEKTSKKRAKRQKRKEKLRAKKAKGLLKASKDDQNDSTSSLSSSDDEGDDGKESESKPNPSTTTSPENVDKTRDESGRDDKKSNMENKEEMSKNKEEI